MSVWNYRESSGWNRRLLALLSSCGRGWGGNLLGNSHEAADLRLNLSRI